MELQDGGEEADDQIEEGNIALLSALKSGPGGDPRINLQRQSIAPGHAHEQMGLVSSGSTLKKKSESSKRMMAQSAAKPVFEEAAALDLNDINLRLSENVEIQNSLT